MQHRLAIGIATVGRAAILRETLTEISRQTRQADRVIVCGTKPADVEGAANANPAAEILLCAPGLPRQRNAILAAAADADIVVFFDDDFLPDAGYLAEIERLMGDDPAVVLATGRVLADGIRGPGLSATEGRSILQQADAGTRGTRAVFSGYGCNMAVRTGPMRGNNILFDERLPLYGWQEDVDLSCRLAVFGRVVQADAAFGVHLGIKSGRGSGVRLGYSQIANPFYLARKRDGYPIDRALKHVMRNVVMNAVRSTWPERYVDRRGRLCGNLLAFRDLITGRMVPERILEL